MGFEETLTHPFGSIFNPENTMVVEHIDSPRMTLRLHAMISAKARMELNRQREEILRNSRSKDLEAACEGFSAVGECTSIGKAILRTLLYFDIWNHPLTLDELHMFLPDAVSEPAALLPALQELICMGLVFDDGQHYAVRHSRGRAQGSRRSKERRAALMWKMARVVARLMRTFPFVRAVWVSGELSKNVASPHADIDFFIVTEPRRLWIARSMLILFKKAFLLNSRKFFCLNSFIDTRNLESPARNIYQAIEIASLKPLVNEPLLHDYFRANAWIWSYFPNFDAASIARSKAIATRSWIQRGVESLFRLIDADALDDRLMRAMRFVWTKRYPDMDDRTRERILRSTKNESRAYFGDFEERILEAYRRNLREYHIAGS